MDDSSTNQFNFVPMTGMMRELSTAEHEILDKRRREFGGFVSEIAPVLSDFAERLGLANPGAIVTNPKAFLEDIDKFMRDQSITEEDRIWIIARLAYFIGQIFIQRFGGEWLLNERTDSRFFLRYVVGRFPMITNPEVTVDPLTVASDFLVLPPGRSLERIILEATEEILKQS